ncbi:MAG TPA: rhamnulokinase family protein [Terriglobales bacterium]|nr:rhamnulokinase family protein [Terriglobales bacterium]
MSASHGHDGKVDAGVLPSGGAAVVAIDFGAESCRVSLLRWQDGSPHIQLVHRFANSPVRRGQHLHWDLQRILQGVEEGLRMCAALAPEGVSSIGVDGWAVDYVRLDASGAPAGDPFCYRDERTIASQREVHAHISPARLYELTGIQDLPLNTLYQLAADRLAGGDAGARWVNLPEFALYFLGGKRVAEYTNATHTQLLGVHAKQWCAEIFAAAGLEIAAAPRVVPPGTVVGSLQGALASLPAFRNTKLICPACHDTASAIAGIQAEGDEWAFISSGTWSLVGCVLASPCTSAEAHSKNFSNEGGVGGKVNFLKNVNGMWLLRQCMDQWQAEGHAWQVEDLIERCRELPAPAVLLHVDDPDLLLPGNMPARINAQRKRNGQSAIPQGPQAAPQVSNLIFHSLAARYAAVLRDASHITGRKLSRVYIVGGGSRNALLNELTARATGLEVIPGAVESATLGNFAVQLAALSHDDTAAVGVSTAALAHWAHRLAESDAEPIPAEAEFVAPGSN